MRSSWLRTPAPHAGHLIQKPAVSRSGCDTGEVGARGFRTQSAGRHQDGWPPRGVRDAPYRSSECQSWREVRRPPGTRRTER
jgi:hypothetical protein